MINYIVGYGLLLTTPEGKAFTMYEKVVAKVQEIYNASEVAPEWLLTMSLNKKSEHPQLILGRDVELDKTMDFELIHAEWEELMKTVPEEIKALLKLYGQNEPNVYIMIGNS
jgi:hypothetical protein